jgi:hypothetical protein
MKTIRHVCSAPYALLEPTLVRVVVDGDEVVGFATGPIDTLLWEDVLERSWWPALRRRYPDPEDANPKALRFWSQNSFKDLNPTGRAGGRTVWMGRS